MSATSSRPILSPDLAQLAADLALARPPSQTTTSTTTTTKETPRCASDSLKP